MTFITLTSRSSKEFHLTAIETGNTDQGFIELKSPDNIDWAHTRIVVKGAYTLLGKLKNKIQED